MRVLLSGRWASSMRPYQSCRVSRDRLSYDAQVLCSVHGVKVGTGRIDARWRCSVLAWLSPCPPTLLLASARQRTVDSRCYGELERPSSEIELDKPAAHGVAVALVAVRHHMYMYMYLLRFWNKHQMCMSSIIINIIIITIILIAAGALVQPRPQRWRTLRRQRCWESTSSRRRCMKSTRPSPLAD